MKSATEIARQRIEKIQQRYLNQLTFGSWNNAIYWILQIIMLFGAITFVALAVILPSDPVTHTEQLNSSTSIQETLHNDNVTMVMTLVRLGVFIAGVGFLFAAMLCSKVRKRSNLLMQVKSDLQEVYDELAG
jgi:hypothetical protein